MSHLLTVGDRKFLTDRAMPYLKIRYVSMFNSNSLAKWPDIWVQMNKFGQPAIMVTREWRRQTAAERRKRLVHELLHILGEQHGKKRDGLLYSTYPDKDTYSKAIYRQIVKATRRF